MQLMEKEQLVSSLRGSRTDSESSSVDRLQTDVSSAPGQERSVHDFTARAPLIETLQRELSSAQVSSRHLFIIALQ